MVPSHLADDRASVRLPTAILTMLVKQPEFHLVGSLLTNEPLKKLRGSWRRAAIVTVFHLNTAPRPDLHGSRWFGPQGYQEL